MDYSIQFAPAAERDLKALPKPIQLQVGRRIDKLATDPRPQGVEKIKGEDDLYRVRHGDYRILYTIKHKKLTIIILKIGDRKEVYRRLPK